MAIHDNKECLYMHKVWNSKVFYRLYQKGLYAIDTIALVSYGLLYVSFVYLHCCL